VISTLQARALATGFPFRTWFCLAVATIAAAAGSLTVESASVAGRFGPGDFSDHSNWDIPPAFVLGLLFVTLYIFTRARAALTTRSEKYGTFPTAVHSVVGKYPWQLVPATFAIQIAVLFSMENLEQLVTVGRILPNNVWLGGPTLIALGVHCVICIAMTFIAAFVLRTFAEATVDIIRRILEFVSLPICDTSSIIVMRQSDLKEVQLLRASCGIAERAPPLIHG
jgi:hypothetical protein